MPEKIKIAFDLDGVIIDKPPIISRSLLEKLFKGFSKSKKLHYRFPKSKIEQMIRKISHWYLLRPPIKRNIEFIKGIAKNPKYEIYAVSGRYSFLKRETEKWFEERKIENLFKKVCLNTENEQPHLFKERVIKEIGARIFVDDDEVLADYLANQLKDIKIFCLSYSSDHYGKAIKIHSLDSLLK